NGTRSWRCHPCINLGALVRFSGCYWCSADSVSLVRGRGNNDFRCELVQHGVSHVLCELLCLQAVGYSCSPYVSPTLVGGCGIWIHRIERRGSVLRNRTRTATDTVSRF